MSTRFLAHRHGTTVPLDPAGGPPGGALPPPSGPAFAPPAPGSMRPSPPRWHRWLTLGAVAALLAAAAAVAFVVFPRSSADFVADSMDAPDGVVAGEPFSVALDVSNTGDRGGEHEFVLLVDGVRADRATVSVDAESSRTVQFEVDGLDAGAHELAVEGSADVHESIRVLAPAQFVIDELTVSQERIDPAVDPVVVATARYSNVGEVAGSHVLQLTVDGTPVEQREVSLEGAASGEAAFTLTMATPGHPVIGVDAAEVEVWVLAPAQLSIGSVTVTPNPADLAAGNVVFVSAAAANVGEADGSFTLELTLDGFVIETRGITVPGGQTIDQQFAVTLADAGLHLIGVNGTLVEVPVYWLERPADGAVLVNELGGGPNVLTIDNERDEDVYVVLTATGVAQPPLLGVYVYAGSIQTVDDIPAGAYTAYFVHGSGWDAVSQQFTENADYGRFDEDAWFESSSYSYTEITLTFGTTLGSSPTSSVDPADFPQ